MGRTLHYTISKENGKNFTKKEKTAFDTINSKYNHGIEHVWTCENFYIDPYLIRPTMDGKLKAVKGNKDLMKKNPHDVSPFEILDELEEQKRKEDPSKPTMTIQEELMKEGLVEGPKGKASFIKGFTKVQGNELNALMVLTALVHLSKMAPKLEIELSDEGEFLLCPLKIKEGKAIPKVKELVQDLQRLTFINFFENNGKEDGLEYTKEDFDREFLSNMIMSSGNMEYINERLRNLKEIEKTLKKEGLEGMDLICFNLENRSSDMKNKGLDPFAFSRKVNPEDFVDYERSPATLMDGFRGEAFGLSNEDPEKTSYEMIAKMQEFLGGLLKEDDTEMRVLGEDNDKE